jgi:hypothetical protein
LPHLEGLPNRKEELKMADALLDRLAKAGQRRRRQTGIALQ